MVQVLCIIVLGFPLKTKAPVVYIISSAWLHKERSIRCILFLWKEEFLCTDIVKLVSSIDIDPSDLKDVEFISQWKDFSPLFCFHLKLDG